MPSSHSAFRVYRPSVDNLRNLLMIRAIALLGQTAMLAYVVYATRSSGSFTGVVLSLVTLALLTGLSLWRTTRPWPVADREFLAQLLLDVLGWTALMYFFGGANNPFISYFIVPVVVAAAVLPWRHTWLVAAACVLAYSLLLSVHQPFPLLTPQGASGHARAHVLGMWFNFLFSVGFITYFVVRMAAVLRRREERESLRREERLRNDQVMAVASLAAGTAHELGTPLATMTLLVDEMLAGTGLDPGAREDCLLLRRQLAQCRSTLGALGRTAELGSSAERQRQAAGEFARHTLERWAVRRPGTSYRFDCAADSPLIETDATLAQALDNLLNNAADSGSAQLDLQVCWDLQEIQIHVRDYGPGIAAEHMEQIGKPFIYSGGDGLGIGLLLSQATVERHGGRIELRNLRDGGLRASLYLPRSDQQREHPTS